MGDRISDDELRRLLAVSEGSNFPLAFKAAGQLGEISPELAAEVLQLREKIGAVHGIANELSWDRKTRDVAARIHEALSTPPAHVVDAVKREAR